MVKIDGAKTLRNATAGYTDGESRLPTKRKRVCLVTEELAGVAGSGGIGAAFFELALLLVREGHDVDVLYCPIDPVDEDAQTSLAHRFAGYGIKLEFLRCAEHVEMPASHEKRAFAVARILEGAEPYDVVHFHDYKGLAFFAVASKRQGLAFHATRLVVQLHGPTRWALAANAEFFVHEDQLRIDFLERESIRRADDVVSPSEYLVEWLRNAGFELPPAANVHVIRNVCSHLASNVASVRRLARPEARLATAKQHRVRTEQPFTDVVLFARHEERKGFLACLDALDALNEVLQERGIKVHFFGKLGEIEGRPSLLHLVERSAEWRFSFDVRTNLDRDAAVRELLALRRPLVVVASPFENSPYTVLEVLALGVPLLSSAGGGGPELIEAEYPGLFEPDREGLTSALERVIVDGLEPARMRMSLEEIESRWLSFHDDDSKRTALPDRIGTPSPKVCFGITHFERPGKLIDAVVSAVRQTYPNIEIIVVDDGSKTADTRAALEEAVPFFQRTGVRFIQRENGYLGAARNTILANTDAEYVCFFDDDDYAFPDMIETLVTAATNTDADVVNGGNRYMDERNRQSMIATVGDRSQRQVSYIPTGGPLSLALTENCLGGAVSLLKASALRAVGGYSELRGIGHEDYELYLRLLQAGYRFEIVPRTLYLYEVGRPSMLSRTSLRKSFRRTFDVVDSGACVAATRDLLSLRLGVDVATKTRNRQWWLASLSEDAQVLHTAMHAGVSTSDLFDACIRLASTRGNSRCSAVLADEMRRIGGVASTAASDDSVPMRSSQPSGALTYTRAHRAILMDAGLRRAKAVLRGLRDLFAGRRASGADVAFALRVVEDVRGDLVASDYIALADAIESARVPKSAVDECRHAICALHALGGKLASSDAFDALVAAAAERYFAANVDVAAARGDASVVAAVSHYVDYGSAERRSGFESIDDLAETLDRVGIVTTATELLASWSSRVPRKGTKPA
jgi:glycosyltransferase involved in cell wall biosynthesis/GT2 family glycosyltransferase